MKISYNWLRQYINTDKTPAELEQILTDIGLEVEGMETYESIPGGLKGVVVGHVLECEQHENADKLSVTKVDVGTGEPLQIVCGAPNVAAGLKVIVATVGTTLYPDPDKPFPIKKSKIRGVSSMGMLCAEDELGLGQSHAGILELPKETAVGTPASEFFNIENDTVFEIGLTPNRSDATSHLGTAEDLAARLKIEYGHEGNVTKPSVDAFEAKADLPIEVVVENETACPRYSGVIIKNLQIKASPDWLKQRLEAIGVKVINNVVDITNFILHELGQPLHAFDYDEITGKKIIVKNLAEGSTFLALDETERKLNAEDLMICDAESKGMCIGGVFGGIKSGVKDSTTTIFLESAYFEPRQLRRTSTRHLLRTDAAKVFEKGADPNNTVYALKRAALLMQELAGGEIASEIVDLYPTPIEKAQVLVKFDNVTRLIGAEIPKEDIKRILAALNIDILEETEATILVSIPTNKHDVTREADVIEEILRIYGFNQVEFSDTLQSTLSYSDGLNKLYVRNSVSDMLTGSGFYEMMGLSITKSQYHNDILPIDDAKLVYIHNTANQGLDVMRPTMLFSGLESVLRNQNRQSSDLKLYEFGKTYIKQEAGKYQETEHLSILLTGNRTDENWIDKPSAVDYYTLKSVVDKILTKLGIEGFQMTPIKNEILVYGLKYHRGQQGLVEFGRVNGGLLRKMGIKQEVYYADFNWGNLLKGANKATTKVEDLSKYPYVRRDLALIVDKSVNFSDIASIAQKQAKKLLKKVNLFDVYENEEHVGKGKKSCAVSFIFQDNEKTLKDKDVEKLMGKLIKSYEYQIGATIRK
jgi:phenylalanyl-tRNA synthetase beta chain